MALRVFFLRNLVLGVLVVIVFLSDALSSDDKSLKNEYEAGI